MAGIFTRFGSRYNVTESPVQILDEDEVEGYISVWNSLTPTEKSDQELFLLNKKVRSRSLDHVNDCRATLSRLLTDDNDSGASSSTRRAEVLHLLGILEMRCKNWEASLGHLNQIDAISGPAAELRGYVQTRRAQGPGLGVYCLAGGVGASLGLLALVNNDNAHPHWVKQASMGFQEAALAWQLKDLLEDQIRNQGVVGCARAIFATLVVLSSFKLYFKRN